MTTMTQAPAGAEPDAVTLQIPAKIGRAHV